MHIFAWRLFVCVAQCFGGFVIGADDPMVVSVGQ